MYRHNMEEIADAILEDGVFTRDSIVAALDRLFTDKIADIWSIEDVHVAANEVGVKITDTHAREVLRKAHRTASASVGINWDFLGACIDKADPRCVKLTDEEAASGETIALEDNHV